MNKYQNIETNLADGIFTLSLTREDKRNAINEQTMDELIHSLENIPSDGSVFMAVLNARGKDFCAGADLEWMRNTGTMNHEELKLQNSKLQKVFRLWFDLPLFTIAAVQGNVIGGGLGLVAASDLVIAHPDARFRFSEVTLGLIPATIAPYIYQRTYSRFIRNAMLTAIPFDASKALEYGVADIIADNTNLQQIIKEYKIALSGTEPKAVATTKGLLNDIFLHRIQGSTDTHTNEILAQARLSEAATTRISAFLNSTVK